MVRQAHHKQAPYFALNSGASDFAKASAFAKSTADRTTDKSQGRPYFAIATQGRQSRRAWCVRRSTNIEILNPKQIRMTKIRNSKQRRYGLVCLVPQN